MGPFPAGRKASSGVGAPPPVRHRVDRIEDPEAGRAITWSNCTLHRQADRGRSR